MKKRNIIASILIAIVILFIIVVSCFYRIKIKGEYTMNKHKTRLELSNEKYKELFETYPNVDMKTDPELM